MIVQIAIMGQREFTGRELGVFALAYLAAYPALAVLGAAVLRLRMRLGKKC